MVIVKFVKNYSPYVRNDIAGIEDNLYKKLAEKGICEKYTEKAVVKKEKGGK